MDCDRVLLVILGAGFIVTTNVFGVPTQPFKLGVTVIVPEIALTVLFKGAVHAAI
jgi:hypothetical protein